MAFLSEIANKVVPLINLHLVANRLGVEAFGLSQYALWLLEWGIILTTFGFPQVAPVMLRNASSPEDQRHVNGSVVIARLMLAALSILLLVIAIESKHQLLPYKEAVLYSSFILIASALESTWILAAKQKLAVLSLISIIAKLLSVVALFKLIHAPEDAVTFVVITCLINSIIAVASFLVAVGLVGFSLPQWKNVKRALLTAAPFALAFILFWGVDRFDLYLVEQYFGASATGLYAAASKLIGSITPIIAAVSAVFYSEMLAQAESESVEKLVKASLFWIISILAPVIFFLRFFDKAVLSFIFGPNFTDAASVLLILGVGTIFFAAIFIFGFQLLAIKQKWRPLVAALIFGSMVGASLGYFAVVTENLSAVAVAAVAAKAAAGAGITWVAVQTWNLRIRALVPGVLRSLLPTAILAVLIGVYAQFGVTFMSPLTELSILLVFYGLIFCGLNLAEVRLVINYATRRFRTPNGQ
jgi:O-antigen/teichoic acid export membrane protein